MEGVDCEVVVGGFRNCVFSFLVEGVYVFCGICVYCNFFNSFDFLNVFLV